MTAENHFVYMAAWSEGEGEHLITLHTTRDAAQGACAHRARVEKLRWTPSAIDELALFAEHDGLTYIVRSVMVWGEDE